MIRKTSIPILMVVTLWSLALDRKNSASAQGLEASSEVSTFKAAVYAHAVFIPPEVAPVTREKAVENMEVNLAVYREQTAEASSQGAEIIVFPEDGVYGMMFDRETIFPYLEYMPDPNAETWIPCDDPTRYENSDVQVALSCMAKNNQLYLVANIGDKQLCDIVLDPACPSDGRYQYNTDVAYGPDGTFLAKYHKYNLFFEDQFDTPVPTPVYFDTPFGRFGMMTCFDVLFKEPGITLVEQYNITNMAFPTAWMDALPLLPAIGFHSSFARAHGINFLGANLHLPLFKFDGSGLYTPDGAHAFYYGGADSELEPKLLVAEMNVITKSASQLLASSNTEEEQLEEAVMSFQEATDENKEFNATLFEDVYTFRTLDDPTGTIAVCQNKICCQLEYAKDEFNNKGELFAFGAFDGLHTHDGNYYMQNCALVKCKDAANRNSCGEDVLDSATSFTRVKISGQVQTVFVYPQVVVSSPEGKLGLTGTGGWTFAGSTLETEDSFNETVLNAILLGRDYARDSEGIPNGGSRSPQFGLVLLCLIPVAVTILVVCLG